MRDITTLSLTTAAHADTVESLTDAGSLDLTIDQNEAKQGKDAVADANSFVLLMAQVIANNLQDAVSDEVEEPTNQDTQITLDEKMVADESTVTTKASKELPETDLNENVALTWINSDSYIPPQTTPEAIASEADTTAESRLDAAIKLQAKAITTNPAAVLEESSTLGAEDLIQPLVAEYTNQSSDKMPQGVTPTATNEVNENSTENSTLDLQTISALTGIKVKPTVTTTNVFNPKEPIEQPLAVEDASNTTPLMHSNTREAQNPVATPTVSVPVHLSSPQWADQFSDRIIWLSQQGIKSAQIKIHPEDLGPLEINIKVVKDSAAITINSHSAHVTNIIDQSIPRLRDMMASQGLNLSEVHVGSDDNARQSPQQNNNSESGIVNNIEDEVLLTPIATKQSKGLIDYFA